MKKNKFIASAIAALSLVALAGCDLEIRDKYSVGDSVDSVIVNADGSYSLTATAGLITKEGKSDVLSCETFGTTWATQDSSSMLKLDNPLYGKDASEYSKVTITFDMYADAVQTYSGALGWYDTSNGGFVWFTNANMFINTTANAAATTEKPFFYFDYNAGDLIDEASLDEWRTIKFEITKTGYAYYIDDEEIFNQSGVAGTSGSVEDGFKFFFNCADAVRVGTGVSFWDYKGANTWLHDIKIKAE